MRLNASQLFTQAHKLNASGVIVSYRENIWLENVEADEQYYLDKYQQLKTCLTAFEINFLGFIICDEGLTREHTG